MKIQSNFYFILGTILVVTSQLAAQFQVPTNTCRNVTSNADVIVMVDITGSQSAAEIDQEKTAVISFLNAFSDPGIVAQPYVGVGTFNADCTQSQGAPATCVGDSARIITDGSLTNSYGALGGAPDLIDAVNGISGQGFLGNGKGATDIQAALEVAQAELDANGSPVRPDYIILISDGDPNIPGFNAASCNDCTCIVAEDAADNYTNIIEPDTQILAVHFRGSLINCADEGGQPAGFNYMRDRIASDPSLFNTGANLANAFNVIAQDLVCDDQDSCTIDECNPQTQPASCVFTPDLTDSDQDGVPDCEDICPDGDDNLIGTVCNVGLGQCASEGIFGCGPTGGLICDAIEGDESDEICDGLDNDCNGLVDDGISCDLDCLDVAGGDAELDRCGVCEGDGLSCLDCMDEDNTENLFDLDGAALRQRNLVFRALRRLGRKRPNSRRVARYINSTEILSQELYNDSWEKTWSQPSSIVSCGNADFCFDLDITSDVNDISTNATTQQGLLRTTLRRVRRAVGKRTRIDRGLRRQMRGLVNLTNTILADLPTTSSICP